MDNSLEKVLFHATCSLESEAERQVLLDAACAKNPGLKSKIEAYYEAQEASAQFFETSPQHAESPQGEGDITARLNTRIGRYQLIERIGEGGCGVVYLVEQIQPVKRTVALKIIRLGMDTENVISRFEAERQSLALIEHPNIVQVLDAGTTDTGRPYFVMELVQGERITTFCNSYRLSLNQRLELFLQVCYAIHHVHQMGIIHRDIKPSNILVSMQDGTPVPKIIDFGIAKATANEAHRELTLTEYGQLVGTPSYMAPEIAAGQLNLDTRCDIHALGVLLNELLTGIPLFSSEQLEQLSLDEIRRTLTEEDLPRPSAVIANLKQEAVEEFTARIGIEKNKLIHVLKGDLDWIIIKAAARERERRYASAYGLALDVERYLQNEPIMARPPDRLYRLTRLVQRHKVMFLVISVIVFAVMVGFGATTLLLVREKSARVEQERLRAEAEVARSNEEKLKVAAEQRERLAQAAVQIYYNDYEAASALLASVPFEEVPASLEVAQSYSAIAKWHVEAGRWQEATHYYAAMAMAITQIDPYESAKTSLTLIPAAAVLCQAGDIENYQTIREVIIRQYAETSNPTIAEQMIKASFLMPADPETFEELKPMIDFLENTVANRPSARVPKRNLWSYFSLALAKYRSGEDESALYWTSRTLETSSDNVSRWASAQCLLAMLEFRAGNREQAQVAIESASVPIGEAFQEPIRLIKRSNTFWFDWVIARLLYHEAVDLISE